MNPDAWWIRALEKRLPVLVIGGSPRPPKPAELRKAA